MSTIKISLPEALQNFVDDQVSVRGYGTLGEYVRELIRKDLDRQRLRELILEGTASPREAMAGSEYFNRLRGRAARDTGRK